MKTTTKLFTALTLSIATMGFANAKQVIVPADDSATSNVCVAATTGSNLKLRNAIEDARLNKQTVVDKVKCNDQAFLAFVENHGKNPEKIINMMTNGNADQNVTITDIAAVN